MPCHLQAVMIIRDKATEEPPIMCIFEGPELITASGASNGSSDWEPPAYTLAVIIVGIDYGTTYSGISYVTSDTLSDFYYVGSQFQSEEETEETPPELDAGYQSPWQWTCCNCEVNRLLPSIEMAGCQCSQLRFDRGQRIDAPDISNSE